MLNDERETLKMRNARAARTGGEEKIPRNCAEEVGLTTINTEGVKRRTTDYTDGHGFKIRGRVLDRINRMNRMGKERRATGMRGSNGQRGMRGREEEEFYPQRDTKQEGGLP